MHYEHLEVLECSESLFWIQNIKSYSRITALEQNELIAQRFRMPISVSFSYSGAQSATAKFTEIIWFANFAIVMFI